MLVDIMKRFLQDNKYPDDSSLGKKRRRKAEGWSENDNPKDPGFLRGGVVG